MNSKVPEREIPEDLEEIIAKEESRKVKHGCPFFLRLWAVIYSGREPLAGLLLSSHIKECASWSGGGAYVAFDQ